MQKKTVLSRREFTAASALAALSGVAITISACGGSSNSSTSPAPVPTPAPTPTPAAGGDVTGSVGSNHGHTAVITAAELTAGTNVVLDIQGTSDHPHTVILDAAEVAMIAGGQEVAKQSSNDMAHAHTVTFN